MTYDLYPSIVGLLYFIEDNNSLYAVQLEKPQIPNKKTPLTKKVSRWFDAYFKGEPIPIDFPLTLEATPYQRQVYEQLLKIPYGQTTTYGTIASLIGSSPRAVGGAVGKNNHLIIIPCHRVLSRDGLGGFSGGIDVKKILLNHEKKSLN